MVSLLIRSRARWFPKPNCRYVRQLQSSFRDVKLTVVLPKRVIGYIESGKQEGAKVAAGGVRKGNSGYFVEPTIFTNTESDMKIVREEIFGPVAVVIKFETEEEAIEKANDTEYGLAATVFSQNISRALRVAHNLEAGQLNVRTFVRLCL